MPETVIALRIVSGGRPPRPDNPTANRWLLDPTWVVLQNCWAQIPQSRSSIDSLRRTLVRPEWEQEKNIPVTGNGEGKYNAVWFVSKHF